MNEKKKDRLVRTQRKNEMHGCVSENERVSTLHMVGEMAGMCARSVKCGPSLSHRLRNLSIHQWTFALNFEFHYNDCSHMSERM